MSWNLQVRDLQEGLRPLLAGCASEALSPFLDKLMLLDNTALARHQDLKKEPGAFHISHGPVRVLKARKATAKTVLGKSWGPGGADVVINVKRTGIEALMRTDLWIFGMLGRLLNCSSTKGAQLLPFNLSQVVAQYQAMLHHEKLRVVVPEDLASSKTVMVIEYISGVSAEEFIARTGGSKPGEASPENMDIRRGLLEELYNAFSWMAFESDKHTFHCDPCCVDLYLCRTAVPSNNVALYTRCKYFWRHEGNMLFLPPTDKDPWWRVALLDYVQMLLVMIELASLNDIRTELQSAAEEADQQHLHAKQRWSVAALAHFLKELPLDLCGEQLSDIDLADIAAYAFDTTILFGGTLPASNERRTADYMHQHFYMDKMLRSGVGDKQMVSLRALAGRLGVFDVALSSSVNTCKPFNDMLLGIKPALECPAAGLTVGFNMQGAEAVKIQHWRSGMYLTAVPEAHCVYKNMPGTVGHVAWQAEEVESPQQPILNCSVNKTAVDCQIVACISTIECDDQVQVCTTVQIQAQASLKGADSQGARCIRP
ncbi:hypothetical protein COO60DRAFT_1459188 [Scenedesmus sp. NREL 46B-D3]|nr:hypothetical protein COO60DRAFT_1459188 [Scenedesmus sp. NREL 46B-D3]